jgi:peptidoglycan/xylan/chitin deacetylase (PgdA/CDA1 family)
MSVIVLMYHRTPASGGEGFYDVPLASFREQVERMIDAGVSFIRFSDCDSETCVHRGNHVAITFDDGDASNSEAFRFLADRRITPTAFIVRDWAKREKAYLSPGAIADLKGLCEFGGHGASHVNLAAATDAELTRELSASRDFLQDLLGAPVPTMALPGGKGDARVLRFAAREGYRLVGNSIPLPHARPGLSVNRICVNSRTSVAEPLRLATAGAGYWLRRRARMAASRLGSKVLGDTVHAAAARLLK